MPQTSESRLVNLSNFGLTGDSEADATLAVMAALEHCREKEQRLLVFPQGKYHFYPEYGWERQYFISNHDQEKRRRTPFPLIGFSHLTIDGQGSEFIFHGLVTPFILDECSRVTLKRLSIDWERPILFQGEVLNTKEGQFEVRLDGSVPYEVRDGKLIFFGEGWEEPAKGLIEMDPATAEVAFGSGDSLNYGHYAKLKVADQGSGIIRYSGEIKHLPKPGHKLVIQCGKRDCPGIFIKDSQDIEVVDVTVHHAIGMGLIAQNSSNIRLNRYNVALKPGSDRLFTTKADATHFVYCRGTIELTDCLLENQMDDPCNVHGIYGQIAKRMSDDTILIRLAHFQQIGVEIAAAGDSLQLIRQHSLLPYGSICLVKSVDVINSQICRITFDSPLPDDVKEGDAVENTSWIPDLVIRNCTVRGNRARGFLITTPGKVLVEGNYMRTPGAAIKISGDARSWFESGAVRDVTIRGNTFENCNGAYPQWGKAVIDIDPEIKDLAQYGDAYHRNILIEDNFFRTFHGGIVKGHSVNGFIFRGNTIERTFTYPRSESVKHAIELDACTNVVVGGNQTDDLMTARNGDRIEFL